MGHNSTHEIRSIITEVGHAAYELVSQIVKCGTYLVKAAGG